MSSIYSAQYMLKKFMTMFDIFNKCTLVVTII